MLVLGDTNSCLAVIPAKRRKIPIFHMEAGNRCFDQRVPEEINRRIVDHTADVNLTYSTIAREYLLREGLPPDLVIKTGSPMFEVLDALPPAHRRVGRAAAPGPRRRALLRGQRAPRGEHRVAAIVRQAGRRAERGGRRPRPAGDRVHPSAHAKAHRCRPASRFHPQVRLLKPLGFHDYVELQLSARAVLVGQRHDQRGVVDPELPGAEPARGARAPRGHGGGGGDDGGAGGRSACCQGLAILAGQPRGGEHGRCARSPTTACPTCRTRSLRIIHSYTDYVNRVVWKKY